MNTKDDSGLNALQLATDKMPDYARFGTSVEEKKEIYAILKELSQLCGAMNCIDSIPECDAKLDEL